jgi:hypothetical protein
MTITKVNGFKVDDLIDSISNKILYHRITDLPIANSIEASKHWASVYF